MKKFKRDITKVTAVFLACIMVLSLGPKSPFAAVGQGNVAVNDATQFVTRCYEVILERIPDAAGQKYWVQYLEEGGKKENVFHGFYFSQELNGKKLDQEHFVKLLYRGILNREAEPAGLVYWLGQLNKGMSREQVFWDFIGSGEYQNVKYDYTVSDEDASAYAEFITRCYLVVMGRKPDAAGQKYWAREMGQGVTKEGVLFGFFFSQELKDKKLSNADFVERLYLGILDRSPDAGGKAYWVERLNRGETRESVFWGFVHSAEYAKVVYKEVKDPDPAPVPDPDPAPDPELPVAQKWDSPNVAVDRSSGIQMPFQGYYEETITVGSTTRSAKVYIPEGSEEGCYFVALTVPDGMNTERFLVDSGWMEEADQQGFCLFVMEAEDGQGNWKSAEEEAGYIEAAYKALVAGKYYLPFPTFYLVGYGTGGTALQKYAMTNAITVAGAVFINASDIDAAYLTSMGEGQYSNSTVKFNEVPVPVWIISENLGGNTEKVIAYWKEANESAAAGQPFSLGSTLYPQREGTQNAFTACGNVADLAVLAQEVDVTDKNLAKVLYKDFLSKTTRYGGNAGGNVVAERPDYEALGVEFKTMDVDGYLREYLVYVPKALRSANGELPVVYALHGSNQTYKMMFDISRWFEVADKNGFMLVMPTSTLSASTESRIGTTSWNSSGSSSRSDDIAFIEKLVEEVDAGYPVDTGRRYFSGQSNGSMMTNYVGMKIPEYFAAIGSTSGPIMGSIAADAKTSPLPAWLIFGEYDLWSWDLGAGQVKNTLDYWINRNQAGSTSEPASVITEGRYTHYEWKNAEGLPMYRYTQTAARGHSFLPEEIRMLWEDWFTLWSKDSEGRILYQGILLSALAVETAEMIGETVTAADLFGIETGETEAVESTLTESTENPTEAVITPTSEVTSKASAGEETLETAAEE